MVTLHQSKTRLFLHRVQARQLYTHFRRTTTPHPSKHKAMHFIYDNLSTRNQTYDIHQTTKLSKRLSYIWLRKPYQTHAILETNLFSYQQVCPTISVNTHKIARDIQNASLLKAERKVHHSVFRHQPASQSYSIRSTQTIRNYLHLLNLKIKNPNLDNKGNIGV